jgi:hypothetical protein
LAKGPLLPRCFRFQSGLTNELYDAYLADCYLKGKKPSFKDNVFVNNATFKSQLFYPVDIMAAYYRLNTTSGIRRRKEAWVHFGKVCQGHGLDFNRVYDALKKIRKSVPPPL